MADIIVIKIQPKDFSLSGQDFFGFLHDNDLPNPPDGISPISIGLTLEVTITDESGTSVTKGFSTNSYHEPAPSPNGSVWQEGQGHPSVPLIEDQTIYDALLARAIVSIDVTNEYAGGAGSFVGSIPATPGPGIMNVVIKRDVGTANELTIFNDSLVYEVLTSATIPMSPPPIADPIYDTVTCALINAPNSNPFADAMTSGGSLPFAELEGKIADIFGGTIPPGLDSSACEAIALQIVFNEIVGQGVPLPGFPDGIPPPIPNPLGLIPLPDLGDIMDAINSVAQLAAAPAAIDKIVESMIKQICDVVLSIAAVAELKKAKHLCIEVPLRPDLIGTPDFDLLNVNKKLLVCTDDPANPIGTLLNSISGQHIHALTADSPEEFSLDDRIEQITLLSVEQIEKQLQKAIDEGKIPDFTSDAERARVVRQLDALVANLGNLPKCEITVGSNAYTVVQDWAAFDPANVSDDIMDFWQNSLAANTALQEGHADLIICFITRGHIPLINTLKEYLNNVTASPPPTITDLIALNYSEWVRFFFPCLPNVYCDETIEKSINYFSINAAKVKVRLDFDLSTATLDQVLQELTGLDPTVATNSVYFNGGLTSPPLDVGLKSKIETYLSLAPNSLTTGDLKNLSSSDWASIFGSGHAPTIPPTTNTNLIEETQKLLKEVERCWEIPCTPRTLTPSVPTPSEFDCLIDTCIKDTVDTNGLIFGSSTFEADLNAILNLDECCKKSLLTINELFEIADVTGIVPPIPDPLRFSLMEALYTRGFYSAEKMVSLATTDFKSKIIGTPAYPHAAALHSNALTYFKSKTPIAKFLNLLSSITKSSVPAIVSDLNANGYSTINDIIVVANLPTFETSIAGTAVEPHAAIIYNTLQSIDSGSGLIVVSSGTGFVPINPEGDLRNCLPPLHQSEVGPISYLNELLRLEENSNCDVPLLASPSSPLADFIATRRGDIAAQLNATKNNTEVPIPLIDMVNESLEHMVANNATSRVIRNTSDTEVKGFKFKDGNASKLLCAIPEHSGPTITINNQVAYNKLKTTFSGPDLPYDQTQDISDNLLGELGVSLFDLKRKHSTDITEFALAPFANTDPPPNEPLDFKKWLWRYPVRFEIALEYLGITKEEYDFLYGNNLSNTSVRNLYGYPPSSPGWVNDVRKLSEFLERTCLSYEAFLELWKSRFVKFTNGGPGSPDFPDEKPHDLGAYMIVFTGGGNLAKLKRLIVFIRLWEQLQNVKTAQYSFEELSDIAEVLVLFNGNNVNSEFIRQLAAFQMLRDEFGLLLKDPNDTRTTGTGADRLHLLALWEGPNHSKWKWAVDYLLSQIKEKCEQKFGCPSRPEVIKVIRKNLDRLSKLANFHPDQPNYTWHKFPTHTIRFAEVLCKIYASNFDVEEICFLFTAEDNKGGEDPFLMQSPNEAEKCPLDLPECSDFTLAKLRDLLLEINFETIDDSKLNKCSLDKVKKVLKEEFCYIPDPASEDPLVSICTRFFPMKKDECDDITMDDKTWYCVDLAIGDTSDNMWDEPVESPFFYNEEKAELCFILPLRNEAVLKKLSDDKLNEIERKAVRDLYFRPRRELAQIGFLFENQMEAIEYLIQEPDPQKRLAFFLKSFTVFYERSKVIAAFLADHISSNDPSVEFKGGKEVMWEILKNLYSDENMSIEHAWEDNGGTLPKVSWNPLPLGGAFSAINGLVGTGLLGEYYLLKDGQLNYDDDQITNPVIWREVRGPMNAFGNPQNSYNAPVPTIIPPTEWNSNTSLATICNGFALDNNNGNVLGGAMPYGVRWKGILLIDKKGKYTFNAGTPSLGKELPVYDENSILKWKVRLKRGVKNIEVLSKGFDEEHIPCDCSTAIELLPCAYEIIIDYIVPTPDFTKKKDICRIEAGFQLKYSGPDTSDKLAELPFSKLFRDCKETLLSDGLPSNSGSGAIPLAVVDGEALSFLKNFNTSTLRAFRRTVQRAYKAGLLAHRFGLSAEKTTKNQSEISYLLDHGKDFEGTSYYLNGNTGDFTSHKAHFNFNFLPVNDIYKKPKSSIDNRNQPTVQRQQALFDWWEKIFDYKHLQKSVAKITSQPLWELFLYESDENNLLEQPQANRIERYLGVNLGSVNSDAVLNYNPGQTLNHADLTNEEWAIRIYHAANVVKELANNINAEEQGSVTINPADWASGSSLDQLAAFTCKSLLEDCDPPRYKAVEEINNRLRVNARNALVAYLTSGNRVKLPWQYIMGTDVYATESKHLSELLLMDVETSPCVKLSRVEEAVASIQNYIRRSRMGLEYPATSPTTPFVADLDFMHLWDKRFATFNIWQKCKMREVYKENWIEHDHLSAARKTEAFRSLEDRLRRQTLTLPMTNIFPNPVPANNAGGLLLQQAEPVITQKLPEAPITPASLKNGTRYGFDQLGTPEVHGRPSWLTSLTESDLSATPPKVPYWIEAAIRLGKKFVRVAAAGQPLDRIYCPPIDGDCCKTCIEPHQPLVDEYYFWLVDSKFFQAIPQSADWNWHSDVDLPTLLSWTAEGKVLLAWTKIHNGEFQQLRFSDEGVHVVNTNLAEIEFMGRTADTLRFKIIGGITPVGYPNTPEPGFRYDLVPDAAIALPQLTDPLAGHSTTGGLSAFPSFAYFSPGATILPLSIFSSVLAVTNNLKTHCRFELALKVYEQYYNPLTSDNTWPNLSENNRAILLYYLETLLQWGDALMRQHAPEAFQQARLVFDTACKILGICPVSIIEEGDGTIVSIGNYTVPVSSAVNPRLLNLFEEVEDRLSLIRTCQNAARLRNGMPNKDMPYFGDAACINGWQTTSNVCVDEFESCLPQSPYRFQFLLQKAQEFAGEVTSLGGALLSAYEKGDGEYLASLRAYHEKQLLELALSIRQDQWRAADWDVQGLYKTKEMAQIRLAYNQELYNGGLNGGESDYVSYTHLSLTELILSKAIELGAQILRGLPDILAGLPQMHLPITGSKLAGFVSTISQVFSTMSQYHGTYAGLRNTEGGWDRREREWLHQIELITIEIQQIERQILGSERRRDVSLKELNNHVQQIENSKEVFDL